YRWRILGPAARRLLSQPAKAGLVMADPHFNGGLGNSPTVPSRPHAGIEAGGTPALPGKLAASFSRRVLANVATPQRGIVERRRRALTGDETTARGHGIRAVLDVGCGALQTLPGARDAARLPGSPVKGAADQSDSPE